MHRQGHAGIALLVYAPVAYVLLRADQLALAAFGLIGMFLLEPLPDRDMEIPGFKHRGGSHTVLSATLIGLCVAGMILVAGTFVERQAVAAFVAPASPDAALSELFRGIAADVVTLDFTVLAGFGFSIGILAVGSHLLGDVLTPMGIRPFWPVSARKLSLNLWTASNRIANPVLFVFGIAAFVSAVWFGAGFLVPTQRTVVTVLQEMLGEVVQEMLR